jgi:hypothetical protein
MIFYTDFGVPDGFAGCARGPLIFIRPSSAGNKGLLEHEKVHRRQWLRTFGLHSLLYLLSRRYRLAAEVEAYTEQLRWTPSGAASFARYLASKYNLGITEAEAAKLLKPSDGASI